jgi:hypothetical protein
MHNFGRGMWRRVGDYERIQVPLIEKMNQYQIYTHLMQLRKQKEIKEYREKILKKVNADKIQNTVN